MNSVRFVLLIIKSMAVWQSQTVFWSAIVLAHAQRGKPQTESVVYMRVILQHSLLSISIVIIMNNKTLIRLRSGLLFFLNLNHDA